MKNSIFTCLALSWGLALVSFNVQSQNQERLQYAVSPEVRKSFEELRATQREFLDIYGQAKRQANFNETLKFLDGVLDRMSHRNIDEVIAQRMKELEVATENWQKLEGVELRQNPFGTKEYVAKLTEEARRIAEGQFPELTKSYVALVEIQEGLAKALLPNESLQANRKLVEDFVKKIKNSRDRQAYTETLEEFKEFLEVELESIRLRTHAAGTALDAYIEWYIFKVAIACFQVKFREVFGPLVSLDLEGSMTEYSGAVLDRLDLFQFDAAVDFMQSRIETHAVAVAISGADQLSAAIQKKKASVLEGRQPEKQSGKERRKAEPSTPQPQPAPNAA